MLEDMQRLARTGGNFNKRDEQVRARFAVRRALHVPFCPLSSAAADPQVRLFPPPRVRRRCTLRLATATRAS